MVVIPPALRHVPSMASPIFEPLQLGASQMVIWPPVHVPPVAPLQPHVEQLRVSLAPV